MLSVTFSSRTFHMLVVATYMIITSGTCKVNFVYLRFQANCNRVWAYLSLDHVNPPSLITAMSKITYIADTKCMNGCRSVIYRLRELFGVILEDIDVWQLEGNISIIEINSKYDILTAKLTNGKSCSGFFSDLRQCQYFF